MSDETYADTMRLEPTEYESWLDGAKQKVDEFSDVRYGVPQRNISPDVQMILDEHFRAMAKLGNGIAALCRDVEERDERIIMLEARIEELEG